MESWSDVLMVGMHGEIQKLTDMIESPASIINSGGINPGRREN